VMDKHTPGPWSFSNGILLRVTTTRGALVICGVHRIGKHGGETIGDPVANGRLISAAPDGLDLAKRFAVYQVEEDEGFLRLKVFGVEVARHRHDSDAGAALLRLDIAQRAFLAKVAGKESSS
jgi:hypothetical protein